MNWYWKTVWILFGIFMVANAAFLGSVPGLLGDEGSEGENVWELLQADHLVIQGERSYIGPLIDYVRVPFIRLFGYTPLALRVVMLLASCATFWLAASVLKNIFGEAPALFALALGFFNPIYLTQARLGWAITLFPFFAFLILYLFPILDRKQGRVLLAGLVAGIALSNHILFLPTVLGLLPLLLLGVWTRILSYWPGLVGFWAGFGMQFAILVLNREDQGDVGAVAELASQRFADLPKLLPHVLSGSSYIASYTGVGLSEMWQWGIVVVLSLLTLCALLFGSHKRLAWVWLLGIVIQLVVLLYMIDRFSLRYFAMPVMEVWMLAGIGIGVLTERFPTLRSRSVKWGSVAVAGGLVAWGVFAILVPFLKTGGSTAEFSLGNRLDTAAAQVDVWPLVKCLRGAGPVFSENIHIWNRLQYVSHEYSDLVVVLDNDSSHADWLVQYRDAKQPDQGELCPRLTHFRVVAK